MSELPGRVLVLGAAGMAGQAVVRAMRRRGCVVIEATRKDLDARRRDAVLALFRQHAPDAVVVAAATVGGIHANDSRPAEFILDNLEIATASIAAAHDAGVPRLLYLGSSCIYPRDAAQPMAEEALLGGALEATNEPYAIAKIAGIKLCESFHRQYGSDFRSVMPTNLFGPGDRFDDRQSHVIPALMLRFHRARLAGDRRVTVWGSGNPRREFLHVDDLAEACAFVLGLSAQEYWGALPPRCAHLNVGSGTDVRIADLAASLRRVVGLEAELEFDTRMPDGTPRKWLDCSRLNRLGWRAEISLDEGLRDTYAWFQSRHPLGRND